MKKDIIYITGHRNPDTDSVVSAIAYSMLKNRQGEEAVPCRLGKLNPETKYLLERFGFEEPMLFEDARPILDEIDIDSPVTITPQTTIYETLQRMADEQRQCYGVVNKKGQLLGMVSKGDFAVIGLGDTSYGISLLKETSIENIAKTIKGHIVYDDKERHFNGKVSIIAINESRLNNYDVKDRLVILGNDQKSQIEAIKKGAGILVVVWAAEIEDSVIEAAKEHHCPIIISGHGSMNTSRYIYFAPSVDLVMQKKLITFNVNEFVEDAGKKMMKSRYRSYPVVDNDNVLKGYISRYHILKTHSKRVILVDHNEYSQSVKGIEDADLLEVVDHHRIGDIITSRPISFRNEIIGSTASIITTMYLENQMKISKELAGLLLGAILSDTLKFRSPTTTPKDIGLAKHLAQIAELDIDEFADEMFRVSSNISQKSPAELIRQDIKSFEIGDNHCMIAQVIVSSVAEVSQIEKELQKEIDLFTKEKGLDLCVVAFTSILENGSVFYSSGKKAKAIFEAFPDKEGEIHSFHPDVLSRKNQIVPMLSKAMLNNY